MQREDIGYCQGRPPCKMSTTACATCDFGNVAWLNRSRGKCHRTTLVCRRHTPAKRVRVGCASSRPFRVRSTRSPKATRFLEGTHAYRGELRSLSNRLYHVSSEAMKCDRDDYPATSTSSYRARDFGNRDTDMVQIRRIRHWAEYAHFSSGTGFRLKFRHKFK